MSDTNNTVPSNNSNNDKVSNTTSKILDATKKLTIGLLGNPNCGKTALFNAITGSKQRVANYSGVTVTKKHGFFKTANHIDCTLIDLPGVYSLQPRAIDEQITYDVLLGTHADELQLDMLLCVLDASNLSRGLSLLLELQQLNKPIIVVVNMIDLAQKYGYKYDFEKLNKIVSLDIIETIAINKQGIFELLQTIEQQYDHIQLSKTNKIISNSAKKLNTINYMQDYVKLQNQALKITQDITIIDGHPSKTSEYIDNILLSQIFGLPILAFVLFFLFQLVFSIATIPQSWIQDGFLYLQNLLINLMPEGLITNLLVYGILSGISAVFAFLPQIILISLFIILLEDSGYMSRAAFLMDKLMRRVGLNGRSFIPLLSSFACAIPAIIATRSIDNQKDRLITILITPIIPCSARAPIYTLLISTFIPKYLIFGVLNLQGLVMFCVYLIGIIIALIVGFIMKLFITKNIATHHYSIIELPSYKLPILRNVILELLLPIKSFIFKAGGVIVAVMTLLWALSNFPLHAGINNSLVALIAKFISPIFIPIGFNWQIIAALIPGFMAREIVVSALGAIYAIANSDNNVLASLSSMLHSSWSIATGLSLLTWYIFAPQCLSTLAIVRRETNNLYITFIMFAYQLLLAYVSAFLVYNLFAS